jgi:hypothetical protein
MHQQCWQWGMDIRAPQGNLLLDFGFQRARPPEGRLGSSRYQLRLSSRATITLWGFGFYYARSGKGGVYVNRYECEPRFGCRAGFLEEVWTKEAVPVAGSHPPDERTLLYLTAKAYAWISGYERWVLERFGVAYRRSSLREWHEAAILPERFPGEWMRLSEQARDRTRQLPSACSS